MPLPDVIIFNLATGHELGFTGLTPRMALICADRQSRGDYNTWDYPKEADVVFRETDLTIGLGDVSYLKPEAGDPEFIRRALATRDSLLARAAEQLQDYCAEINGDLNDALSDEIRTKVFPC